MPPCRTFFFSVAVLLQMTTLAHAEDQKLKETALKIFESRCFECHGKNSERNGTFKSILDLDELAKTGVLVPGNLEKSKLVQRITRTDNRQMPPLRDADDKPIARLTPDEIGLLKKFVQDFRVASSPTESGQAPYIPYTQIQKYVLNDLRYVLDGLQIYQGEVRYFDLSNLDASERTRVLRALDIWINFLSWGRRVVHVSDVQDPKAPIVRIHLPAYRWKKSDWDKLVALYPHKYALNSKLDAEVEANFETLQKLTGTKFPVIRADWFLSATQSPFLYHELLKLPKTRDELKKMLSVNDDPTKELRAGLAQSNVAFHNRVISRKESEYGSYWETFDFDFHSNEPEKSNIFGFPLDWSVETLDRAFVNAGGEIIFTLPNGLHGYYVIDGKGKRLDTVPFQVASHPKVPHAIRNGGTCLICHSSGFESFKDDVAEAINQKEFRRKLSDDTLSRVNALYGNQTKLQGLFEKENTEFAKHAEIFGPGAAATIQSAADIYGSSTDDEDTLSLKEGRIETKVDFGLNHKFENPIQRCIKVQELTKQNDWRLITSADLKLLERSASTREQIRKSNTFFAKIVINQLGLDENKKKIVFKAFAHRTEEGLEPKFLAIESDFPLHTDLFSNPQQESEAGHILFDSYQQPPNSFDLLRIAMALGTPFEPQVLKKYRMKKESNAITNVQIFCIRNDYSGIAQELKAVLAQNTPLVIKDQPATPPNPENQVDPQANDRKNRGPSKYHPQ